MRTLLSFLLLLECVSCNTMQEHSSQRSHEPTDEILAPYVLEFERIFETSTTIPVVFTPTLEPNIIAICERPTYVIRFSREVYLKYAGFFGGEGTSLFKKWVLRIIKHEMGHCHYNRPHINTLVLFDHHIKLSTNSRSGEVGIEKFYIPQSIMYPYLLPTPTEQDEEEYYRLELIGKNKGYNQLDMKTYPDTKSSPSFEGFYPHYKDMGEYIIKSKSGDVILKTQDYQEYLEYLSSKKYGLTEQFEDPNLATGCGEE